MKHPLAASPATDAKSQIAARIAAASASTEETAFAADSYGMLYENDATTPSLKKWFKDVRASQKTKDTDKVRLVLTATAGAKPEDMCTYIAQEPSFVKAVGKTKRYGTQFLSEGGSRMVAKFLPGSNALIIYDTSTEVREF